MRSAVFWGSVDVVSYLLNKHTYPLNTEYSLRYEESNKITPEIVKLLLDHGADPATRMCSATSANAIMAPIHYRHLEVVAQYIRRGVDIDLRSWAYQYGHATPFEASVLHGYYYISVMLLKLGCSRGIFINLRLEAKPELVKLMKAWDVHDKNMPALQIQCRNMIVNHLSPRADLKINQLRRPPRTVKFLTIPELDGMIKEHHESIIKD